MVECLTSRGMGTLSNVSTSRHERVPMSCLEQLNALDVLTMRYIYAED